jgi:transcriptional regulator with XRE-family HTH domain
MGQLNSPLNIVGQFIRTERERKGLSQKALGQMFTPPVTTQFISNIERGVTPLPPVHIQTLTKIFDLGEEIFLDVFEKEYVTKLSQQVGRPEYATNHSAGKPLFVSNQNFDFMKKFVDAYQIADHSSQEEMKRSIESFISNTPSVR